MSRSLPVTVTYFSDVLCIWAYAAQVRLLEVSRQFGDDVRIDHQCCSVFGNTADRIGQDWAEKGGYPGFNRHLRQVGRRFEHINVHPEVWLTTRPASSDSAHVFVKAIQLVGNENGDDEAHANGAEFESVSARFTWELRCAFFEECRDVSTRAVQYEIAEKLHVSRAAIQARLDSGAAFAALAADYQRCERYRVEGSPTFVLNQGRQKLYGNVGYRVIEANIRELLHTPGIGEMSWC